MTNVILRGLVWSTVGILATGISFAYLTDGAVYAPPSYNTFTPPAKGSSYTDPVFGATITRMSQAPTQPNGDGGGML